MSLRIFVYYYDDYFEVKNRLTQLLKTVQSEKEIKIEEQKASGLDDNNIIILTSKIQKSSQINKLLQTICQNTKLKDDLKQKLSDDLNLYIRLKKEDFLEGKHTLTLSGDCLHITIAVASYPKTKENAQLALDKFLQSKIL